MAPRSKGSLLCALTFLTCRAAVALPAGCAKGRVVRGLNVKAGGDSLLRTKGCAQRCAPHAANKVLEQGFLHGGASGNAVEGVSRASVDAAVADADYLIVGTWQGFGYEGFRFVPEAHRGDATQLEGKHVPKDKILVSRHMDPYDLAGRALFDLAPFINVTMSYSLRASVPMTFARQDFFETAVAHTHVPAAQKPGFAVWVSSNCRPAYRQQAVQQLMEALGPAHKLDSRGGCMRNAPKFPSNGGVGLDEGYSTYKFAIVIENSVEIDWVTEKFFLPFLANTVPVYYGAPNIADFAPGDNSFINMRDFDSAEALAQRLVFLSENEGEYAKYFAWRKGGTATKSATLDHIQRKSTYRDDLFCDVCDCVCDPKCTQSAGRILHYAHLPQVGPWEAPTQKQIDEGAGGAHPDFTYAGGDRWQDEIDGAFGRKQNARVALHDGAHDELLL